MPATVTSGDLLVILIVNPDTAWSTTVSGWTFLAVSAQNPPIIAFAKAADGTIRKLHAKSIGENSVHGSDASETAAIEIAQFFSGNEIVG